MGLDCIFHLRGVPYSRWTFSILWEWRSLAADCPISIIFTSYWYATWYTEKGSLCLFCFQPCLVDWALRRSPNNLTHSPHRSWARNPVTWRFENNVRDSHQVISDYWANEEQNQWKCQFLINAGGYEYSGRHIISFDSFRGCKFWSKSHNLSIG